MALERHTARVKFHTVSDERILLHAKEIHTFLLLGVGNQASAHKTNSSSVAISMLLRILNLLRSEDRSAHHTISLLVKNDGVGVPVVEC